MSKEFFKGSVLFGPLPAVLVTTVSSAGVANVFTVSWTGIACSHPPMLTIAVRKERLSYENIRATSQFVVNLTTAAMLKITDFCGCRSGRKVDKIKHFDLQLVPGVAVAVPSLELSPVALECRVVSVTELGSHDLFVAEIVGNKVDRALLDAEGKIRLGESGLLAYCHGEYFALGRRPLGTFGYSVAGKAARRARAIRGRLRDKDKKK
jgi:flavin reductase (DIM6/NTAB) family NADH-FMN oxidoreductase RutF